MESSNVMVQHQRAASSSYHVPPAGTHLTSQHQRHHSISTQLLNGCCQVVQSSTPTMLDTTTSSRAINQWSPTEVNQSTRWSVVNPPLMAIAISNFADIHRKSPASKHYLEMSLGDILVIVEQCGQWYRGYFDLDQSKIGIFPVTYVQIFDEHHRSKESAQSMFSYFYTLLDPLFLQVVRTLREWHYHLVNYYRTNSHSEKFLIVRNLIYELIEMCTQLNRELAPSLWRRRSSQLLKINSDPKDPFAKLYLDEEENDEESQKGASVLEPSLEELYDRILSKLNQGNQHLNLDIMPSFTHGTFHTDHASGYWQLLRRYSHLTRQYWTDQFSIGRRNKFRPYYTRDNSKYLTYILDYYNRINRRFNQKFKSNISNGRHSMSFHSPMHTNGHHQTTQTPANLMNKKYRRHLLFSIRDVNFSSLVSNLSDPDQCPVLQIDAYILRCNHSANAESPYEVLTEKYCYRVTFSGQQVSSRYNVNRALFLDVLCKKSSANGHHHLANSSSSDSSNYYLVIQVWRYGKMLVNESRTKNMLSATASTGSSVFHTISSSSMATAASAAVAAAASTTSLSSLTSFVTNVSSSSLFSSDKANSSSTSDSASIDSSEFGGMSFKRSVGFSVIPLLELVSRDQEMKPSSELFQSESFISRLLLSDEQMLLSVPVKLYEGDLTPSSLETMLKHRQALNMAVNSTITNSSNSSSSISKLSPVTSNYQLIVCAKFISELMTVNGVHSVSSKPSATSAGSVSLTDSSSVSTCASQSLPSLADHLLLSQSISNATLKRNSLGKPNFILVQKRFFGDLITAGYFRNDFYVTLESADFEKGGKTIPKNIEVSACLLTETGIQERAISSGANDEPVTIYRSHIQYHQNSPKWFEQIKISVPLEQFESAHLRFTFSHCSSKERERKFLGFAFLPLADLNGACLPDGEHELHIYKCESERKLDDPQVYLSLPWTLNDKLLSSSSSSNNSISSSGLSSSSSTSLAASSVLINSRSNKEVFHIRTNLISSKLTQNSDILSLLKWGSTPREQVYDALQRIGRVSGEEMVKFLEDILNALFALFTSSGSIESSPQVTLIFRVLVDFLKTLNDPKFASYRAALETYIENQFSTPLVYSGLMACIKKYIELVIISFQTEATSISGVTKRELEFILRCLSVFDWILKFIVQSRILYTRALVSSSSAAAATERPVEIQSDEDFRSELVSLFSSINRLLAVESKSSDDYLIIAIQESVLSALPSAFSYLSQILTPLELAKLVKSIVHSNVKVTTGEWSPVSSTSITPTNSTPSSSSKRTIINAKLSLLQQTIRCSYVWGCEEARIELLDTFIRLLNICISESKHCLGIVRDIVVYLIEHSASDLKVRKKRFTHSCDKEIEMLSIGAIDSLVEHIIELTGSVTTSFDLLPVASNFKMSHTSPGSDDEDYLGTLIVCLMVLLDFMTLRNYEKLFETRSTRQCKELILNIFVVFLNALYYFPENWLETKMAVNRIILHSMTMLRTIMSQEFLGQDKFDLTIWRMYFKLAIAFLTQQRLQMESQPYWKKKLLLDTYGGDMRILMGFELVACWELIGPFKISFIPNLVSSFVDVTLVPELELRKATIPIFYDMIMVDYNANGNFKQVEAALIDKLDVVAHKYECDIQFKELFTQILTEKIETYKPCWYMEGVQLVKSMSRLLMLLIDYRNELKRKLSTVKSVNDVDDRLLICTYILLRFFRDEIESSNRKAIMLRYLDKLANLHVLLGNYSEAAFTLKLHADQLSWSPNESGKKESLCETMLNYFERGQCWEEGIGVCKDLQDIYQRSYKYTKLSANLKRYAELLDKILTEHRPDCEYFRVSFYGLNFPFFLQNSTFIFRGLEFEKIASFTHRIQQEFPNAQLLTKIVPSDENITESHCQYIQIFAVKPVAEPPVSSDQSLIFGPPDPVLTYYQTNSVSKFIQDRPIQRAPFDPNNEFKSLWIERTIYTTEKPLPGILRMFQVVSTQVTYLTPIENASESIENMNNQLLKLITQYSNEATRPESISILSMRLQGILDAAVNGGIAKYIEAFLSSEFLTSNPDQMANVTRLKDRIATQIQLVESGLTLHGRQAPTAVRPLHTRLLERFATMRNTVNQANIETSQALLWTPSQSSLHRPSILSQPLPPIPSLQRQDTSSDPETSSLSSSSSNNVHCASTPPLLPPPPPPQFVTSSPSGKSIKNKPLPPLPPNDRVVEVSPLIQRKSSYIEHARPIKLFPEDSIYSVPQYIEMNGNGLLDNESSVDDTSLDFLGNGSLDHASTNGDTNGHTHRNIFRSRSIPRSSISLYNGTGKSELTFAKLHRVQSNHNLPELTDDDEVDSSPPPLPPRAANLDRSNSLNSSVRSNPMMPPAVPQRPVKKSASTSGNASSNGFTTTNGNHHTPTESYLTDLDGVEFGNLVISSPTPRTESSNPLSRPAPIIGIEKEIDSSLSSFLDPDKLQEHRAKSSSLPRMQQFTGTNLPSTAIANACDSNSSLLD